MKVSISGNIGVGKSTLIEKLGQLGYNVSPEIIDQDGKVDVLLKDYYSRMDKDSFFELQRYFFQMRLRMFQDMDKDKDKDTDANVRIHEHPHNKVGIIERCPGEDEVFLYNGLDNGIVSQEDIDVFLKEYHTNCPLPDVIVYLYNPKISGLKTNIVKRGRKCESDISEEYLCKVEKRYETFMDLMSGKTKVLFVESSSDNGFVDAESLMEEVKHILEVKKGEVGKFYF